MVFKLFPNVEYKTLAKELEKTEELRFNKADVYVDIDAKKLILHTDNGNVDINFDDYDKLLDAIIQIGRGILINDIVKNLDNAKFQLGSYPHDCLKMAGNEIRDLMSAIERTKNNISRGNFKFMMELGFISIEDIGDLPDKYPEIKRAVEESLDKYDEICGEEDPDHCYRDNHVAYVTFYAVPEEKKIVATVDVEWVNDLSKVVKDYNNSSDFLKAIDEFMSIIKTHAC